MIRIAVVLPAPFGPEEPHHLTARHGERDAVQGPIRPVALGQVLDLDHGLCHPSGSSGCAGTAENARSSRPVKLFRPSAPVPVRSPVPGVGSVQKCGVTQSWPRSWDGLGGGREPSWCWKHTTPRSRRATPRRRRARTAISRPASRAWRPSASPRRRRGQPAGPRSGHHRRGRRDPLGPRPRSGPHRAPPATGRGGGGRPVGGAPGRGEIRRERLAGARGPTAASLPRSRPRSASARATRTSCAASTRTARRRPDAARRRGRGRRGRPAGHRAGGERRVRASPDDGEVHAEVPSERRRPHGHRGRQAAPDPETVGVREGRGQLMRYDVIEGHPFGLGGEMRVEARAGR